MHSPCPPSYLLNGLHTTNLSGSATVPTNSTPSRNVFIHRTRRKSKEKEEEIVCVCTCNSRLSVTSKLEYKVKRTKKPFFQGIWAPINSNVTKLVFKPRQRWQQSASGMVSNNIYLIIWCKSKSKKLCGRGTKSSDRTSYGCMDCVREVRYGPWAQTCHADSPAHVIIVNKFEGQMVTNAVRSSFLYYFYLRFFQKNFQKDKFD